MLAVGYELFRKSTAFHSIDYKGGALHVIDAELDPVRIAEIELAQIPMQMSF